MKYSLVPVVATTILALASANVSIPQGCTHKDNWGNAIVENDCSFDVYYILDNEAGKPSTISPGQNIKVPVYQKPDGGGMNVKLFKDPNTNLWNVPSLTQFELTAADNLYYDISNVNSDIGNGKNGNGEACDKKPPFMNDGLKMSDSKGKSVSCAAGVNPCKLAYSLWNDDHATTATDVGNDVTLTICPGGSGSSSGGSQAQAQSPASGDKKQVSAPSSSAAQVPKAAPSSSAPAAAPSKDVSQAPKQAQKDTAPASDDLAADVVYVTQVVTAAAQQVTVFAHAPAQAKEKREEHLHQHVHNKIHKRRHEA